MKKDAFKILFVASEAVPFSKTGGLADVAGALPRALQRQGCDVKVLLPFYRTTREAGLPLEPCLRDVPVEIDGKSLPADVLRSHMGEAVPFYLVAQDDLFDRAYLYGTPEGDYPDNALRFIYLCKSVFSLCQALSFSPDVIHCNDWQTALVPAYLRYLFGSSFMFRQTRTLLTLHNIAYQGTFPPGNVPRTGLPDSFLSVRGMEFWGRMNFLKGGIRTAHLLNTVSPTYSREILTAELGCGLEGVLAERISDIYGILNGADYDEWDPGRDPNLPSPYGLDSPEGKRVCKAALLEEIGFGAERVDVPLFGMISRLTSQKGVDLVLAGLGEMVESGVHFVLLGDGEARYSSRFKALSETFSDRFCFRYGFDTALAHRIQGGIDFLLMPSRYEPCGLNQIYSMRYGTIPVVRATGGLKDTVKEFSPSTLEGTGFLFEEYDPKEMLRAVQRAVSLYRDGKQVDRVRANCMEQSFSWERAAEAYLDLYGKLRGLPLGREEM